MVVLQDRDAHTWQNTANGSLSGPSHESSLVLPSMKVPSAKIT